jgi:Major intrinsic protein
VLIFVGGLTSGGSFNPARQLGPLLFAARFSYLWAYLLGPIAGAVILAVVARVFGLPRPLTCDLCGTARVTAAGAARQSGVRAPATERGA